MINLSKNQTVSLSKEQMDNNTEVKMFWETAIDLDLHMKSISQDGSSEHIYYGNKSGRFGKLDQDAGIGNKGGKNSETMTVKNLSQVKDAIIYVQNFGASNQPFDKYKASLLLKFLGNGIKIDMNSSMPAKYFVVCMIKDGKIVNINKTSISEPSIESVNLSMKGEEILDQTGKVVKMGFGVLKGGLNKLGRFLGNL